MGLVLLLHLNKNKYNYLQYHVIAPRPDKQKILLLRISWDSPQTGRRDMIYSSGPSQSSSHRVKSSTHSLLKYILFSHSLDAWLGPKIPAHPSYSYHGWITPMMGKNKTIQQMWYLKNSCHNSFYLNPVTLTGVKRIDKVWWRNVFSKSMQAPATYFCRLEIHYVEWTSHSRSEIVAKEKLY